MDYNLPCLGPLRLVEPKLAISLTWAWHCSAPAYLSYSLLFFFRTSGSSPSLLRLYNWMCSLKYSFISYKLATQGMRYVIKVPMVISIMYQQGPTLVWQGVRMSLQLLDKNGEILSYFLNFLCGFLGFLRVLKGHIQNISTI